jgi:hypothetical protein
VNTNNSTKTISVTEHSRFSVNKVRMAFGICLSTLILAVAAHSPTASAAVVQPGDFSDRLTVTNPTLDAFDDCSVDIGVVLDTVDYPYYRRIGGVRINCRSVHRWIDATVAIGYWDGTKWVQYGVSSYGVRYNQNGSGAGIGGILSTNPYCVGAAGRQLYWSVVATVRTERATKPVQSAWVQNSAGC